MPNLLIAILPYKYYIKKCLKRYPILLLPCLPDIERYHDNILLW